MFFIYRETDRGCGYIHNRFDKMHYHGQEGTTAKLPVAQGRLVGDEFGAIQEGQQCHELLQQRFVSYSVDSIYVECWMVKTK
jgi:hypothetical protein